MHSKEIAMHRRSDRRTRNRILILALAFSIASTGLALAAAPALYKDPFRQSPVRAEPGDLLMIAGAGFATGDRVAYQLVANTTTVPNHPNGVPSPNTASSGEAAVVLNASDALTIQLPSVMTANQSYVLWVKNTSDDGAAAC